MRDKLIELLPEINWVENDQLREGVIATYLDALQIAGLMLDDMSKMSFVWKEIPNTKISYLDHVRGVTRMCKPIGIEYNSIYADKFGYSLDQDKLIAGALLHDIGKLLEYEIAEDGFTYESDMGKYLRHPFSGAAIAFKNGLPLEIVHIIATHSREGDGGYRSPEAFVIIRVDSINFDPIRASLEII